MTLLEMSDKSGGDATAAPRLLDRQRGKFPTPIAVFLHLAATDQITLAILHHEESVPV